MKKIILTFIILNILESFASHLYKESYYQKKWCDSWHGVMEYRLSDDTRVDCSTKTYAVEFDFAPKWAESVGQSLYYAQETNKKPAIVLILEKDSDFKYFKRTKKLAQKYDIQLWYMKMLSENYQTETNNKSVENILYDFVYGFLKQIANEIMKCVFG